MSEESAKVPEKNPEGRPPFYKTSQELQFKIDEYFEKGVATKTIICGPKINRYEVTIKVPTITGLVLYCGFCNRASFYDMELKPEFANTIKDARTRIEREYEELLQSGLGAGAIFALKNFGWHDKTEHEVAGKDGVPLMAPTIQLSTDDLRKLIALAGKETA